MNGGTLKMNLAITTQLEWKETVKILRMRQEMSYTSHDMKQSDQVILCCALESNDAGFEAMS